MESRVTVPMIEFNLFQFFVLKDNDNKYIYIIAELFKLFQDMSKHLIKKARMHAAGGQAGMLKMTDAQVNHFFDFLQLSGVM